MSRAESYLPVSSKRGASQASKFRLVDSHSFLSHPHQTITHLCTHAAEAQHRMLDGMN